MKILQLTTLPTIILLIIKTNPLTSKECNINSGRILGVVPGDFDGNGAIDVLITIKEDNDDQNVIAKIIWTGKLVSLKSRPTVDTISAVFLS